MITIARPAGVDALEPFVEAGVLGATEIEVVTTLARAGEESTPEVLLAAALAVRGPLLGHVCVDLATVAGTVVVERPDAEPVVDLPWPSLDDWLGALASSPLVASAGDVDRGGDLARPLVLDGSRLYLHRYWRYEQALIGAIVARGEVTPGAAEEIRPGVHAVLDRLFGPAGSDGPDWQRLAAESALTHRLTVIAGGPGTGKTRTVARLLAVLEELALDDGRPLDIRLAAPTGKAASRMTEAVVGEVAQADLAGPVHDRLLTTEAVTLHRLLGADGRGGFRHHADDPLPADVVVVDESSMVSLPLMARLFDAVRPDARVVLVGDPSQLASVEAGAVLGDLTGPVGSVRPDHGPDDGPHDGPGDGSGSSPLVGHAGIGLVVLDRVHRFDVESPIAHLADLVRTGDADAVVDLLRRSDPDDLRWVDPLDRAHADAIEGEVVDHAREVISEARADRAADALAGLGALAVLSATRFGPTGVATLNRLVEHRLAEAGLEVSALWYPGRPIIVTANDYLNQVANGDIGITVIDERPQVAFSVGDGIRRVDPSRLDRVDTWWAMTIHKSQGSEFGHVIVVLPPPPSPILTRELLYTAVTRASSRVTLLASEESIRAALARPVSRASGLADQLRRTAGEPAPAASSAATGHPGSAAPDAPVRLAIAVDRPAPDAGPPDDPQLSLF